MIGAGLGKTDVGGDLIVGGVDGGEGGLNFVRGIDAGDQGGIQHDAVARGGALAFVVHVLVEIAHVFADVVDRDADGGGSSRVLRISRRIQRCLKGGDALAQDADEVAHDVGVGVLHAEDEGVEIALGDAKADLAIEPDIELILGDGIEDAAGVVGGRIIGIPGHVHRAGGDVHFVHGLPRPFKVRTTRLDDAHLRVVVAQFLIGGEMLRDGIINRAKIADALRTPEAGFDRAFVLIDRVKPGDQVTHQEPDEESNKTAKGDGHKRERLLV